MSVVHTSFTKCEICKKTIPDTEVYTFKFKGDEHSSAACSERCQEIGERLTEVMNRELENVAADILRLMKDSGAGIGR